MSLRFIYGRAGSGKSYFCYEDIKRHIEKYNNKKFILIVPEQFSLESEKKLIRVLERNGIINAEILSFKRLAFRIFDQEGGRTGKRLNKPNKLIIISRIIKENEEKLPFYSKAVNKNGFVNNISDLITEFKSYSINIDEINNLLEKKLKVNTKIKIEEFKIIFDEYESYIKNRFNDPDDDLTMLASRIPLSDLVKNSFIWIDEFSGYTPEEYKVIEGLINTAINVNITITSDILFDENKNNFDDIFRTNKITINKIVKIAHENNIKILTPVHLANDTGDKNELHHLEEKYFSYPNSYYNKSVERINICRMSNMFEEISFIGKEIEFLTKAKNYKYSDINVICRNPENYFESIRGLFNFYNIPVFLDKNKDIEGYPLIIFMKSLLLIFIENYNYKNVFGYLKTGLSGISERDIDELENHVLEYGIKGSYWKGDERWEFGDFEENRYLKNIKDNFLLSITNLGDQCKGENTVINISRYIYTFLLEMGIKEKLEILYEKSTVNLKDENIKIWNLFMEIIDSLVNTIGNETVTLSEYLNYIEIALSESKLGILPENSDTVFVGSIDRSINHDVKILFIIGVNDGIFPIAPEESGILNDIDRRDLKENGLVVALDTKERVYEEEFLVYKALTSPSEKLYLTYLTADPEGKSMRPSSIITRTKKIFPRLIERKYIEDNSDSWNKFIKLLKNIDYNEDFDINDRTLTSIIDTLSKVDKNIIMNTTSLYGDSLNTSISRLESYARCPYKYFVEYGLRVQERKILSLKIPDIGTILHDSIEKMSKELWLEDLNWDSISEGELISRIEKIYKEITKEKIGWILENIYSYKEISNRVLKLLKKSICHIANQINRGDFKPLLYEISFGDGLKIPPLLIPLDNGKDIKIHGRIDRVDMFSKDGEEYVRIIDYKSGKKDFELTDVYSGIELQLVTYLEVMESKNSIPGGIFYFKLDDPIIRKSESLNNEKIAKEMEKKFKLSGIILNDKSVIKAMDNAFDGDSTIIPVIEKKDGTFGINSRVASKEEFSHLRKHVNEKIVEYGKDIFDGKIDISPTKKKDITACMYCDYKFICRFDEKVKDNKYKNVEIYTDEYIFGKLKEKYNKEV